MNDEIKFFPEALAQMPSLHPSPATGRGSWTSLHMQQNKTSLPVAGEGISSPSPQPSPVKGEGVRAMSDSIATASCTSPLAGRVEDAFPTTLNVSLDRASANAGIALAGVGQESLSTVAQSAGEGGLLNPGFNLTLRPMRYPRFYEMYRAAIKNTWTVEEIDFQIDLGQLRQRMTSADRHLIERLVAFFATGDSIVSNNLVISLYRHINSPEARMYLSRQLYEEALHIQFYLTLLDNYVPDQVRRAEAFAAIDTIPSIRRKAEFCKRWTDEVYGLQSIATQEDKRRFLLNLTCFAACIEGLFFFGAFAYVYFLRSRGLLPGLAAGTAWVFRDESAHMAFAFEALATVRREEPELFDAEWVAQVQAMIDEAVECESQFAEDVLSGGVVGLTQREMRLYLEYVADQRLTMLGLPKRFGARNPFPFMELQDVQELTNFFERRVSAYQVAVQGEVAFDQAF